MGQFHGCMAPDFHAGRDPVQNSAYCGPDEILVAWLEVIALQINGQEQAQPAFTGGQVPLEQNAARFLFLEKTFSQVVLHILIDPGAALIQGQAVRVFQKVFRKDKMQG